MNTTDGQRVELGLLANRMTATYVRRDSRLEQELVYLEREGLVGHSDDSQGNRCWKLSALGEELDATFEEDSVLMMHLADKTSLR